MHRSTTAQRVRQVFLLGVIVSLLGVPRVAFAQGPALGHFTFGPWWQPDLSWITTAGWEVVDRRGGGVGASLNILHHPGETLGTYREPGVTALLGSVYTAYHWQHSPRQHLQPFATIGFMFAEGIGALDASGGIDWWTGKRTGLRIEVQDAFVPGINAAISLRGGLVFR
jgi:hypothetical protein